MWVFYLISLPFTIGMVGLTFWYFAGPDVPRYVRYTVGYTWFCSLSIIILVPADIWATLSNHDKGQISFFWSWSYWSTFLLTWVVVPILQGYEDAGDFTMTERLKTSAHANLVFYLCVGAIGLFGLVLLIVVQEYRIGNIPGFAMACSNTFGLVTGAFLLGFGLSEIPKGIWRCADWTTHQKILSHKVAKMAVKLDDAHQEFSNAIVVAQATSKQMSKRDPLRPYMNVIDKMLSQMLSEDPSFKPQGGNLGENDMDYDTDAKTMAALRRQLEIAREKYYRYKSEYMNFVTQALELEDTIKNFEHRSGTGWKYVSSFRPERSGRLGSMLDITELIWRCVLAKQLQKVLAILLGCMSASILLAEATILPNGVDLSLFSILINAMKEHEMLVQVAAFIPLMYMCMCTYYSLFKIGMLTFYSLTPRQTSSVSLLMICSMVARYAPPISYNFLNLIHLDNGAKTIFEKRMGNIDDAVPFFGRSFNKIYPLIMVIYTLLIASNFFDRVLSYFGNWKIFKFLSEEADDLDGFDPSGLIILQKGKAQNDFDFTSQNVLGLNKDIKLVSLLFHWQGISRMQVWILNLAAIICSMKQNHRRD
ncbi:LMBR1 domain-containing protein 2 homolog A-like isoform X3 [Solanum tuberosum]|uniref:LMBR1 domain-containing protein 2 homolog A-like isoform X3 n=1 Tax=Solanum tuberosum TaxID=4113 RepID=UPI00073A50FC|nr:PREDICTED: LMBR1 domain-containing protein 2 homolog A-like isoform X3 [Solanum tuberosum]